MDKETLSNYGWIVILVLILSVLLALATPFGNFIAGAIKATTAGFFSVNQGALGAAGIHIPGQDVEDPFAKKGCAVFDNGDGTTTTLTWDELMLAENGEKYDYDASVISDTEVGEEAFWYNDTLLSIVFPLSITTIGEDAFRSCKSLTTVDLSGCTNLTTIEDETFTYCESLTTVDLSGCASLTTIACAFYCCESLTTVDFSGCTALTTVGYEDYEGGAFDDCESLLTMDLSECTSLTFLGCDTFYYCTSLTSVLLPSSLEIIDQCAFQYCESLISITIPAGVNTIGDSAFYKCTSLNSITFEGTIEQWNAITFGSNWNKNVPATYVQCSDGTVSLS